jgi:glutamate-ammonia-ligase adenylyltransferase
MSKSTLTACSRFHQRWLAADPARAAQLAEAVAQPLSALDLAPCWRANRPPACRLPRAMRRLRNLLVCGLIGATWTARPTWTRS